MADSTTAGALPVPPIRTLVISTAFSFLVSLVVFAVTSMAFVFPVIEAQRERLGALAARIEALESAQARAEATPPPAPAPVAPPAVAAAPVAAEAAPK
jgi:hypothetical protein